MRRRSLAVDGLAQASSARGVGVGLVVARWGMLFCSRLVQIPLPRGRAGAFRLDLNTDRAFAIRRGGHDINTVGLTCG